MSVVTFEKPCEHISLADWYATQWRNQQTNDTRRNDAFALRHDSRQLRHETRIRTEWTKYHNNVRLSERICEMTRWKSILEACMERINRELKNLKDEHFDIEKSLDALGIPLGIISECISIRDCRLGAELTYDDGDTELKKELCLLENVKKLFIERSQATWEKINRIEEVKFKVNLDINDKHEAIEIDKQQLNLDNNCSNISYKLDPLATPKNSISYDDWLKHTIGVKQLADNELVDTLKFLEASFVVRNRAHNDMIAQRDQVDFTLRKRIYETQKARNEAEWQQLKIREDMEKLTEEVRTLEESLGDKVDALKLAETRLENRSHRPGFELARDEPEFGLKNEVVELRQTIRDLTNKLNCAKATLNALENQMVIIDRDVENKNQSLMTDVRCLDLRMRLRKPGDPSETDRNIKLTKMEDEIPPK